MSVNGALRVFCSDFPDNITRIIISHTDYKNNLSTKKQIGLATRSVADAKGGWAHTGEWGCPH